MFLETRVLPCTRQVDELTADLHKRSGIPKHVEDMIRSFPKDMHAMSMFGAALFALQVGSERAARLFQVAARLAVTGTASRQCVDGVDAARLFLCCRCSSGDPRCT